MKLAVERVDPIVGSVEMRGDVVLIHGTGANATLWGPQVKLLQQQGYRCFIPDLRGHGLTGEPGEDTDVEVHIQDLLETLEHSEIRYPAIFVGHSLGAIIGVVLAQRQPELFSHILAVSMPGKVLPVVYKLFDFILGCQYEVLKGSVIHKSLSKRQQILFDTPRHSLKQIVSNFARVNFVDSAPMLSCPVHFCVGRLDMVAPYFYVQRMQKALPNSSLKIFEWAGHCCMDDQERQFNEWFMEKVLNGSMLTVETLARR